LQAEPLIHWPEPIIQFIGFVAEFLAVGSVGFRYAALRGRLDDASAPGASRAADASAEERAVYANACARAALIGLSGAIVSALLFGYALPDAAARAHTTVVGLLTTKLSVGLEAVLTLVGIVGLGLAAARRQAGWALAAVGVILGPLSGIVDGQWLRMVNPVHRMVAGLWLGTLFVLLVAGLDSVLRDARVRDRRGAMVADMVNGFSPLALTCGIILVLSGLVTAWRHLNPLSSLWTTPYGWALMVKLALVAVVFALGAWNWRRQRPMLGSEDAAIAIRRSTRRELTAAVLVLAATAIVVSLPSPRPPKPPGEGPPAAAAPVPGPGAPGGAP
jgi:putative copper export protein